MYKRHVLNRLAIRQTMVLSQELGQCLRWRTSWLSLSTIDVIVIELCVNTVRNTAHVFIRIPLTFDQDICCLRSVFREMQPKEHLAP
jgi:hypothetical protein